MTSPAHLVLLAPYGNALWGDLLSDRANGVPAICSDLSEGDRFDRMAEGVLAAAPDRFHLAGFCMGGSVALEILRRAPDRVQGLALINASVAPDSAAQAHARRERMERLRQKQLVASFPDAFYLSHAAEWMLSPKGRGSPELVARVRSLLAETPLAQSLNQQRAMATRADHRALLRTLRTSVLVVGGLDDRVCEPQRSIEIARSAPGAEIHLLDNCGHLAPIERPDALTTLMMRWIGRAFA